MWRAVSAFFSAIKTIFTGRNLIWHGVAIVATYALVMLGVDWWVVKNVRGELVSVLAGGAGLLGFALPVVVPLSMWAIGFMRKSSSLLRAGSLLAQAEITAMLLSFFYKALTGRIGPHTFFRPDADSSKIFNFGFLENGVFWGWPSSHITVAIAGVVVLMVLYKSSPVIKYLALAYGMYMALAVSVSFHWLSDGVAGVIFGIIVGLAVVRPRTQK